MWRRINRRDQARSQRQQATPAERYAWGILRNRELLGLKFRRQHPIGSFVVDFACLEHKFVIELDGDHHQSPQQLASDAHRDALIAAEGFTVLRISNRDVNPTTLEARTQGLLPHLPLRPPSPVRERSTGGEGDERTGEEHRG